MAAVPIIRLSLSSHQLKPSLPSKFRQPFPRLPNLRPTHLPKSTATSRISCSYTPTPATDRLISAASYFFPLFNGLRYGGFLFNQYPILAVPFKPLFPILSLYHSIPSASFISFFALYLGIVRNPSFSRYVRFNALQALVLDVLLAVPALLQNILSPGRSGLGLKFTILMYNALFVFVAGCFIYGLVSSILGKTPYLPFVAEAAGRQLD
ncbi:OLC1v1025728C1 [Oldenlandia corymbosa var. corymbosa]|uniref:Protein TIC 20 n=1 Tax=Oldenlandia corymbosa var. corymbosa TaxID=529605 RepID=A0AAV1C5K6_OLDCO|nr:OLC1v1025728C1 [Oldenlandia corymbosa var. corymbosa]